MHCFTHQIYDNAMITAGLNDDPRPMISRLNQLLTQALEKHWWVQPDGLVLPSLEPCVDAQRLRPLVLPRSWSHTKHKQTLFIRRLENICAGVTLSFIWKSCFTAGKTEIWLSSQQFQQLSDWRKPTIQRFVTTRAALPETRKKNNHSKMKIKRTALSYLSYLFCCQIIHISVHWLILLADFPCVNCD